MSAQGKPFALNLTLSEHLKVDDASLSLDKRSPINIKIITQNVDKQIVDAHNTAAGHLLEPWCQRDCLGGRNYQVAKGTEGPGKKHIGRKVVGPGGSNNDSSVRVSDLGIKAKVIQVCDQEDLLSTNDHMAANKDEGDLQTALCQLAPGAPADNERCLPFLWKTNGMVGNPTEGVC